MLEELFPDSTEIEEIMPASAKVNPDNGEVVHDQPVVTKTRRKPNKKVILAAVAAVVLIAILLFSFLAYKQGTNDLNSEQRFRAVCEYQGGITVEDYCIRGDRVLTIEVP